MRLSRCLLLSFVCLCSALLFAQGSTSSSELPKLDHFESNLADPSLDPCTDFYKYACSKWMNANPIPPDQVAWGHGSPLQLWNETVLRQTLEKAAAGGAERNAVDQKIGDYYAACMDEKGIEVAGVKAIKTERDGIDAIKSKNQRPQAVARLHPTMPGDRQLDDNQTDAAAFSFFGAQDHDDATKVVA